MKDFDLFISDLEKLIAFKSVLVEKTEDAPFGEQNRKALEFFLSRAKDFGFDTVNYDNYIGEVCFGSGKEIGIIGHLDVVPEGEGWKTDPFALTFKDGFYYGRGISDDKAPLLQCLYALKELKEQNIEPNCKFRLIVGCNEESGWKDVEYFKTKSDFPEYGFSPDGDFPVAYAEKGMTEIVFTLPKLKNFDFVEGGTVVNAVCAKVKARPNIDIDKNLLASYGLEQDKNGDIISVGVAAHGSQPHLGKNAIKPILELANALGENTKEAIGVIFNDSLSLSSLQNEQGKVTLSAGLIKQTRDELSITCDCRIPAPLSLKDVTDRLDKCNINYQTFTRHEPVMVEKEGDFVQTLVNAYNAVSGQNLPPMSMGGSTFARAFKKGCAFGPQRENEQNDIHNANEKVSKKSLLDNYEIYKKAIFDFAK